MVKKILIATGIFPPEIGGPASYAMALAKKLSPDHEITVITYSKNKNFILDKELPFKVVRISQNLPKVIRHFLFLLKCLSLASRHDLIYALNAVSAGWPACFAAKSRRKKFIVKIVGDAAWERAMGQGRTALLLNDFQSSKKRGMIGWLHKAQAMVCRKADAVITPSNYLAKIVNGWGVEKSKIKVIYNGVDFQPVDLSKEEARKKITIHGTIILSVGRLVPWKGFKMLIKIMPELLKINSFFRLVIVGDGPERKTLEKMIKVMNLDHAVYLVGSKSPQNLAIHLAAADLFVLNTGYEGFSHQILESMKAGVPVITTAVGGNFELIKQGENGFIVRYNDEFNLIEAIKTLWQNSELRDQFVEKGKKTVDEFSVDRMFGETVKILELT